MINKLRLPARMRLARLRSGQIKRVLGQETKAAAQEATNNYRKVGEVGKEIGRNTRDFFTGNTVNSKIKPKMKEAFSGLGIFKYAPAITVPGSTGFALAVGPAANAFGKVPVRTAKRYFRKQFSDKMIKFRQKEYTIQSGKYDGPKDMEEVPGALSVIGKTALAGAGIGGAIGYGLDKFDKSSRADFWSGAQVGGKAGVVAGIGLKVLINSIHNPMSTIKYQEVDKQIRQQFGIFRASGITVGDTLERRNKLDEKYSFNDQNILSYKINVAIQDGKFTMYILKLTDKELEDLNKILDYYCKKYFGMSYISTIIGSNKKDNSYAVQIIFTNYSIIADFLSEVSDKLMCKINLLNNKAAIEEKTSEEKTFSIPSMDKSEILEFFTRNGIGSFQKFFMGARLQGLSEIIIYTLIDAVNRLNTNEQQKVMPVLKDELNNKFLETAFNNSGLIEGMHYTVAKKNCPLNIYLSKGTLIISSLASSPEGKKMEKVYSEQQKDFYSKTSVNKGQVIVYTYGVTNKNKLTLLLKKIVASGIKPNVLVL